MMPQSVINTEGDLVWLWELLGRQLYLGPFQTLHGVSGGVSCLIEKSTPCSIGHETPLLETSLVEFEKGPNQTGSPQTAPQVHPKRWEYPVWSHDEWMDWWHCCGTNVLFDLDSDITAKAVVGVEIEEDI